MPSKAEDRLKKCMNKLSQIEQHVALNSSRYVRRSTPVFFTQMIRFGVADRLLASKERALVNNSDNCFITDISAAVFYKPVTVIEPNTVLSSLPLLQSAFGWERAVVGDAPFAVDANFFMLPKAVLFDFTWNYKLASTGAAYRTNTYMDQVSEELDGCFSNALGYTDRASYLRLSAPLRFASGDAIVLDVRPSVAVFPGEYDVSFTFSGFRTEEEYESIWG